MLLVHIVVTQEDIGIDDAIAVLTTLSIFAAPVVVYSVSQVLVPINPATIERFDDRDRRISERNRGSSGNGDDENGGPDIEVQDRHQDEEAQVSLCQQKTKALMEAGKLSSTLQMDFLISWAASRYLCSINELIMDGDAPK